MTTFIGRRAVIAEFGQSGVFDAQLDFVVRHQIGGIVFTAAG